MAVRNFTIKFTGTVAYDDNSHGSFESSATWLGNFGGLVATHDSESSQFNFAQLYADKEEGLLAMLAILGGAITLNPGIAMPDKTVNSFVAEISGTVAYDDGSPDGLFLAQWIDGVVDIFPENSATHWLAIANDPAANIFLTQALEMLAGADNVSISAVEGATTLMATYNPTIPEVVLTWVDNASAELGFKVERAEPSGGEFVELASLEPDVTIYIDDGTDFDTGTTYDYRVISFSDGGDAPASNVESVMT